MPLDIPTFPDLDLPDFGAMTVEEIEEWRIPLRVEMRKVRALIIASNVAYKAKITVRGLGARLRENLEDLPYEKLLGLVEILELAAGRPGDVVVELNPGDITSEGFEPTAEGSA